MDRIPFFKMSGSGNDFIIIDNREGIVEEDGLSHFVAAACRRKMSAGSDGLILVENSTDADFKWRFFNSDGGPAEMCGNGARCVARFAHIMGIAGPVMRFETLAGIIHAEVKGERAKVGLTAPVDLQIDYPIETSGGLLQVSSVNTGVPHVVITVDDLESVDVFNLGREIRHHSHYAPAGTNVNFIRSLADGTVAIRTYERGVEDETLACGTGSVAAAIVAARTMGRVSPVDVLTRSGGLLTIHFTEAAGRFDPVFLEGDARIIYQGELWPDAWS